MAPTQAPYRERGVSSRASRCAAWSSLEPAADGPDSCTWMQVEGTEQGRRCMRHRQAPDIAIWHAEQGEAVPCRGGPCAAAALRGTSLALPASPRPRRAASRRNRPSCLPRSPMVCRLLSSGARRPELRGELRAGADARNCRLLSRGTSTLCSMGCGMPQSSHRQPTPWAVSRGVC